MVDLLNLLAGIVGDKNVSDDPFVRFTYSRDTGLLPSKMPDYVVRPGSVEEVSMILELCNRYKVPVYPRGGGAGITGHGRPCIPGGIVLDMTRMNKVVDIDDENMAVTAQTGITWGELNKVVGEKNLDLGCRGPDSGLSATIGGSISNASVPTHGAHKYGGVADNVLGLQVVLPSGDVIRTGSGANVNARAYHHRYGGGPDITGLFIGDQGIFGVKTEATLKLYEKKPCYDGFTYAFKTLDDAQKAIIKIARKDICTDLHVMHSTTSSFILFLPEDLASRDVLRRREKILEGIKDQEKYDFFVNAEGWIFGTIEGYSEKEVEVKKAICEEICKKAGSVDIGPYYALDYYENQFGLLYGTWLKGFTRVVACCARLPITTIADTIRSTVQILEEEAREYGWMYVWAGTVVENHYQIPVAAAAVSTDTEAFEDVKESLYRAWVRMRDSYIFKYGGRPYWIGEFVSLALMRAYDGRYIELVRKIKDTLDPNHILNPGLFPYPVGEG